MTSRLSTWYHYCVNGQNRVLPLPCSSEGYVARVKHKLNKHHVEHLHTKWHLWQGFLGCLPTLQISRLSVYTKTWSRLDQTTFLVCAVS